MPHHCVCVAACGVRERNHATPVCIVSRTHFTVNLLSCELLSGWPRWSCGLTGIWWALNAVCFSTCECAFLRVSRCFSSELLDNLCICRLVVITVPSKPIGGNKCKSGSLCNTRKKCLTSKNMQQKRPLKCFHIPGAWIKTCWIHFVA